jgi:hypothetical protein
MKTDTTAGVPSKHRHGRRSRYKSAAIATALVLVASPAASRERGREDLGPQPTVTFPRSGDVTCEDAAPSISWAPARFDRFTVFLGTDPAVLYPITSGATPLRGNVWTVPASKWEKLCRHAGDYLYIRVKGKVAGNESAALSDVAVLKVR